METRVCKNCGVKKPLVDFVTAKRYKTGKTYNCKSCANEYCRNLYQKKKTKSLPVLSLPGEIWKDIPEYEGIYQISSLGRVKSCERTTPCGGSIRHIPEKLLYVGNNPKGLRIWNGLPTRKMLSTLMILDYLQEPLNILNPTVKEKQTKRQFLLKNK